jgi:hypothetical protein
VSQSDRKLEVEITHRETPYPKQLKPDNVDKAGWAMSDCGLYSP